MSTIDEAKLLLSFETTLFSNIEAMGIVRLPGRTTDALIMSFADAKVSVVEWEADKRDLGIVSLHYFEKDAGAAVRGPLSSSILLLFVDSDDALQPRN